MVRSSMDVYRAFFRCAPGPLQVLKVVDDQDPLATLHLEANDAGLIGADSELPRSLREGATPLAQSPIPATVLAVATTGRSQSLSCALTPDGRVQRIHIFSLGDSLVGLSVEAGPPSSDPSAVSLSRPAPGSSPDDQPPGLEARAQELALKALGVGVWDWRVPTDAMTWDDLVRELYGLDPVGFESGSEAWLAAVHRDDRERAEVELASAVDGRRPLDASFRIVRPDGRVRWVRAVAVAIRDAGGRAHRLVGASWDVTGEREREDELVRTNKELVEFAHFAAHDLQAPLRHIRTFVGLLAQDLSRTLTTKQAKWFRLVDEGALRMHRLIEDLLAYSRAGHPHGERERTDLNQVLETVTAILRASPNAQDLTVTTEAPLPTVVAHRLQMEQLFQNLLENAARYRIPGTAATVRISAVETPTHWRITVRDDGMGVAPEHHHSVFEAFRRLGPEDSSGSGLGLAICSRIVAGHGGTIHVESEAGRGAAFVFTLRRG